MKREPANIKQVAEKAGVSMMTVSRVINDSGKVAQETREKVLKAIKECHYYPNSIARGLASNKTNIIGIVIYDSGRLRHNMFYEMINGIERIASEFGYNIMLFSYREGEDYSERIVESGLIDGVILMGITINYEDIRYLEKIGFPYVVIGKRNIDDLNPYTVVLDYEEAFQRATQFLIDSGERKIGFAGVARGFDPDLDKLTGYQEAFNHSGLFCDPENIIYFDGIGNKKGYEDIARLYERGVRTFVLTDCGRMRETLEFASIHKLCIPGDLKICIFNDEKMDISDILRLASLTDRGGGYMVPQIEMNRFNVGQEAGKLLLARIENKKDMCRTVKVSLDFIYEAPAE